LRRSNVSGSRYAKAEVYKSTRTGEWFVRLVAANGQRVFKTGDGYKSRHHALAVLRYFDKRLVKLGDVRMVKAG